MIKKTVFTLTITVMAVVTGIDLFAQNAADFEYTVDNGTVTITGYTGSAKNVTIPGRINGLPVTAIGHTGSANWLVPIGGEPTIDLSGGAFARKQLTGVSIPDSVTIIGIGAFANNQLTGVTIPDGVTAIREGAFAGNQLTGVTIPGSVTVIEKGAFEGNRLTSVTIPSSVTAIGKFAFGQNRLTSVTIPDSVTIIGASAFAGNQLIGVTIGAGVTTGSDVWYGIGMRRVSAFPGNLGDVYTSGGSRAGTYTSGDGGKTWSEQIKDKR
jgi:hypothetical protein